LVQTMEQTFHVRPTNVVFATLVKCCVAGGRSQAAGTLLLGLPLATKLQPDQGMYASVLPVLVGAAGATVRDLELAGELLRACAHAPPAKDQKPPCLLSLATQLAHKVAQVPRYTPRASELKEATQRVIRTLAMEQVLPMAAAEALAWSETQEGEVREFVPGQTWAQEQQWEWPVFQDQWGQYSPEEWAAWHAEQGPLVKDDMRLHAKVLMSPEPRKGARDENASPNVMQMLLAKSPAKSVGDMDAAPKLPLSSLNE